VRREVGADTRPGIVVSVASSGDLLQWHVHLHILMTDGAFSDDATFHPLATWDSEALMRLFRERLLARLIEKHAISQELATKLMAWRHPGFSTHVGEPISADDTKALENLAGYVTRSWNGWREWPITSRTRGNIARSSTAIMPIECAEIAPRRSRERAGSKRRQPRSAALPRVGRA
jgi:hypothetical protein